MDKLKLSPGIITGDRLQEVFDYCKAAGCALPAVNVIGSSSINAALQAAKEASAPIIIQFSNGGAHFNAGKFLDNADQKAAIAGAVAGAHHIRQLCKRYGVAVILHTDHAAKKLLPWVSGLITESEQYYEKNKEPLFSSHMLDLSEESLDENLSISKEYLQRLSAIGMALEIELGITGGEEDGVDNTDISNDKLYTQPEHVLQAYETLNDIGIFNVAASFGNTHGVYKPGNVQLRPVILKNSQDLVEETHKTKEKPLNLVFHGGSGSSEDEIREAVSYGVIKMNIDTDTQWAFTDPIKQYMDENDAYLHSQVGNPEGADKPNKKKIDPRAWLHLGEKNMAARLLISYENLNSKNKFSY